jgi:hypothetical protein
VFFFRLSLQMKELGPTVARAASGERKAQSAESRWFRDKVELIKYNFRHFRVCQDAMWVAIPHLTDIPCQGWPCARLRVQSGLARPYNTEYFPHL